MVVFLKILAFVLFVTSFGVSGNKYDRDIALVQDVPLKSDLHGLLASLKRTIKYCYKHKNDIDVNLGFGLFLVHVNLKSSLDKNADLPTALRNELYNLLKQNVKLLLYVSGRKPDASVGQEKGLQYITPLLEELPWVEQLERFKEFRATKPIFQPDSHSGKGDSDWQVYLKKTPDFENWIPNPETSDYCIGSLVDSVKTSEWICKVPNICHHMLRNGTNFGYALTHRLLLLLYARFGRGCSIYSPAVDKRMTREFCGRAYEEAQYIALHDYDYIDLLSEQIALCTLDGRSEFLQRSWLQRLLQHQTPQGCFVEFPLRMQSPQGDRHLFKKDQDLVTGECTIHVTGVTAAALAAAVRFVIEIYY